MFKFVKGRGGSTSFLPIDSKTGAEVSYMKNKEAMCLSEKQAKYVLKR